MSFAWPQQPPGNQGCYQEMTNETCYIIKNVGQEYKKIEPTSVLSSLTLKHYRMLNTSIFIKQRSKKIATLKRLEKYQEVNFEF